MGIDEVGNKNRFCQVCFKRGGQKKEFDTFHCDTFLWLHKICSEISAYKFQQMA